MIYLKNSKGISLIEVLITLLVMSVGMLGVLGLQVNAKRVNYDATQRTLAAGLVQNMVERMRANPGDAGNLSAGVAADITLDSYVTPSGGLGGSVIVAEPTACSSSSPCTGQELAARDLWEWEQSIDGVSETRTDSNNNSLSTGGLVNPTACITHSSGTVTVTIAWYGSMAMTNPAGNTCGVGLSRYDTDDVRRQTFSITTFIDNTL